jgi:3-hydroxyacyl-CoA dehydrogenase / enoyl-CoA hydratase / 3-hydroxybutyryl-CoA epimerase
MALFETSNLCVEQRPGGLAFLRLNVADRPLNVLNRQVFADLDAALTEITKNSSIRLLVLRSDKTSGFVAGADLQEFATVSNPEEALAISAMGQRFFNKLADLPIPTVALIHGPCLGGGLEFALACDYRLAADHPKTQFGFPEIELGLIPGWGGTLRLPRTVGVERALQIILNGRRLTAREALRWGLADALGGTEGDLAKELERLIKRASSQGKRPKSGLPLRTWRQRLLESNPLGRQLLFRGTERILNKHVPDDMPGPAEALRAVRIGLQQGMEAGLAYEREAAGRLAATHACRNLVHLFLQREEARKLPGKLVADAAPEIRRVAVVGAGIMGAGIAQLAAIRGYQVIVQEINEAALAAGMDRISNLFQKAVANRVLSNDTAQQKLASIQGTTTWQSIENVDLVVEAVVEELPIKQAVFRELERRTRPSAILATNTSSLLVRQIQEGLERPERVAGLHFFNPVHKMPLVEVVRTSTTQEHALAVLAQWSVDLGKTPVLVMDSPGFIVNRILMPYLYEAVVLARQQVPVELIDQAMRRFGMPMGPFEMLDQVGLDVATHVGRAVQPVFADRLDSSPGLDGMRSAFEYMVRQGWLGQKTGVGFYRYKGKTKKFNRAATAALSHDAGQDARQLVSKLPKAVQLSESRERMVLSMVNEAAACLGEGLAGNAETIDLAMVLGTGWAPHRGGPLRYGKDRGLAEVSHKLTDLAQRLGRRFEPCNALKQLAGEETAAAQEGQKDGR